MVSSVNFCPYHSYLTRFLSLSMFINHWESLLCKFIFKAPNEPWQPTERLRPHKICGVSGAGTVGDIGPGATERCLALLCSAGSPGVSPPGPRLCNSSICGFHPESTVERAWECLFEFSKTFINQLQATIKEIQNRRHRLPVNSFNWFKSRESTELHWIAVFEKAWNVLLVRVSSYS